MEEKVFQKLQPDQHLRRFLDYNIRPDGRQFNEIRSLSICKKVFKDRCLGSAAVSAGHSRYMAGVTATITTPPLNGVLQTHVIVCVEFPKACGLLAIPNQRRRGITPDLSVKLSQILSHADVFDPQQFVISPHSASWILYVNIVCLEYDGNPFDHCLIAAVSALEDTDLPSLKWNSHSNWWQTVDPGEETEGSQTTVEFPTMYNGRRVVMKNKPLSITLTHLLKTHWIVDSTSLEEDHGDSITVYKFENHDRGSLQFLREGGTPLILSSELLALIPLINIGLHMNQKEIQRAQTGILTQDIWQVCDYNQCHSLDTEASIIKNSIQHL